MPQFMDESMDHPIGDLHRDAERLSALNHIGDNEFSSVTDLLNRSVQGDAKATEDDLACKLQRSQQTLLSPVLNGKKDL